MANNILTDVVPAKARKYVYAGLALAAVAAVVVEMVQGGATASEVIAYVTVALGFGTAASNTNEE